MVNFITYGVILLSVLSQVSSVYRIRNLKDGKGSKSEILDFIGRVEEQGRAAEWHDVTTEDGYTLVLFRIPPNPSLYNNSHSGSPILLQHALLNLADVFITPDPKRNLAYSLSDAGYDVWLGNIRGTSYSNKHQTLSRDEPQFWDFSMDEVALRDLPAMFDYVLETTGKSKLSYVGFSLGSALTTILLSNRTEYNNKLNLVVHFSHFTFWKFQSPYSVMLFVLGELLRTAASDLTYAIFKDSELIYMLVKYICSGTTFGYQLCTAVYDIGYGRPYEPLDFADEKFLTWLLSIYAATSAKLVFHCIQAIRTGEYRYYDYGDHQVNMRYYGQPEPPEYNLSNIVAPHVIFHGTSDKVILPKNVQLFISKLPSTTTAIYEPVKNFNHNDFVMAKDVKTLVFDKLLLILSKFDKV